MLITALTFCKLATAQNLVCNGDFEQNRGCPRKLDEMDLCLHWSVPNLSSPDYFKTCGDSLTYTTPAINPAGEQSAHSGDGYVGIILADSRQKDWVEYIQGELKQKLQAGQKYKLSLYISWPENSPYFFNRLGYLFTETKLTPSEKELKEGKYLYEHIKNTLPKSQGVMCFKLEDLITKKNWLRIEAEFVAKGGEQFITLGVFENNISAKDRKEAFSKTYWEKTNIFKMQNSAYIYIDDVSVIAVDGKQSNTLGH